MGGVMSSVFMPCVQKSITSLRSQEMELESIRCLSEEILSSCHPDSIITLKSWISVTKTRYEEVSPLLPLGTLRRTKI